MVAGPAWLLLAALGASAPWDVEGAFVQHRRHPRRCRVTGAIFDLPDVPHRGSGSGPLLFRSWLQRSTRHTRVHGYGNVSKHVEAAPPQHVIIETPKPVKAGLRLRIQEASEASWKRQPRVVFVSFGEDSPVARSPHGVPVLAAMFEAAIKEFPKASTFTYVNSDIAVDASFVRTADAIVHAMHQGRVKPRFLAVGRRTNVDYHGDLDLASSEQAFAKAFERGSLFQEDAEDYFMVTPTAFDWSKERRFIVGRRGFDNFIVSEAASTPDVDVIDATKTIHALHLTDPHVGNKEGHRHSSNLDDVDYNMRLMRPGDLGNRFQFNYICGTTRASSLRTFMDGSQVRFEPSVGKEQCRGFR